MPEVMEKLKPCSRVSSQNARAFQQVLQEVFGVAFALFDASTGAKISGADGTSGCELDPSTAIRLASAGQALVEPWESDCFRLCLVLHFAGHPVLVAAGVVPALAHSTGARVLEQSRLQNWSRDFCERLRLRELLAGRVKVEEDLRGQVNSAWKVNLALGECLQRLHFNRHLVRDRQRIMEIALQLLDAQALLWLHDHSDMAPLIVGEAPITVEQANWLAKGLSQNPAAKGPEPFLCNDLRGTTWGACFPGIDTLMAFRVNGSASSACLIAVNKYGRASARTIEGARPRAPFRNSDAAILSPFVGMLEMHARAAGTFDELRSLVVALTRSLTSAIDAKDAYTAGHSERVARLALEIGRELGLHEEELRDTYLAGLLHDVGKIGIREAVLCKPSPLTPEEFEHMKQHVRIGYHILQDLHAIRHLLPGVLYHHERIDGKGYPEGLAGEEIPFLARLLAVADGFDAMNSNRPYRPALSHGQIIEELKTGAGTHWDQRVVAAALRCMPSLVVISQRGLGDSLRHAVEGALRIRDSSVSVKPAHGPSPCTQPIP